MTPNQRINLCESPLVSSEGKEIPISLDGNKKRSLPQNNLNKYKDWLVLSPHLEGYFCLYCALFYNGQNNDSHKYKSVGFQALVKTPYINFKCPTGKQGVLDQHCTKNYHLSAMKKYINFRIKNNNRLDQANMFLELPKIESFNTHALKNIIKTIYLCCSLSTFP